MLNKPLVAIVDDDESIRVTTKDLLESAGLNATVFASAEDFLNSGQMPSVSCAIADMRMSGLSGLALHELLLASGRPIPTILMTAYPHEPVRARALKAGVVAYLAKPFTDDELLGHISCAMQPGKHGWTDGGPGPKGLRILIVDDNCDAAATLSMLLELKGHQTCTACNGLDAVQAASSVRYDAVLLDLGMPVMDGFQAASVLAQLQPAPLLIACSAWDDADTRRRTANLGFSAHLSKPVPVDVLEAALSACRRRHGGQTQEVAHPHELG